MRALGVVAGLLASLIAVPAAEARETNIAAKPYMGWSSWSLQATNYPGVNPDGPASWLNEKNVLQQADVLVLHLRRDAGIHDRGDYRCRAAGLPLVVTRRAEMVHMIRR